MRYQTAAAFRQALEDRLRTHSQETGMSLIRLRKMVVFDRLLARLVQVAPDSWVLKGALALDFRLKERARATMDMDLGRRDDAEAATEDLQDAVGIDLQDFFRFSAKSATALFDGAAVRFRVRAELGGRLFEEVIVDIGFSDQIAETPDRLSGPDLLGFADIPPTEVPAMPLEQQIAEKLHAYTRVYATGRQSSRVKDLVDLVIIATELEVDGLRLREALEQTFTSRGTHPLPPSLPDPPPNWNVPYRKATGELGIDQEMRAGHASAAAMLDAALAGRLNGRWDPKSGRWT